MWLLDTIHFSSILATTPLYLQSSCTAGEEAQANLTVAQSQAKSQMDLSRHDGMFEVGDEVVLSTRNISIYLPNCGGAGLGLTESPR